MFKIEVEEIVIHTVTICDEDEKKIKEYIKEHPDDMEYLSAKEQIVEAVNNCMDNINLYENTVESDCYTNDIRWSCYENRAADEILCDAE